MWGGVQLSSFDWWLTDLIPSSQLVPSWFSHLLALSCVRLNKAWEDNEDVQLLSWHLTRYYQTLGIPVCSLPCLLVPSWHLQRTLSSLVRHNITLYYNRPAMLSWLTNQNKHLLWPFKQEGRGQDSGFNCQPLKMKKMFRNDSRFGHKVFGSTMSPDASQPGTVQAVDRGYLST